jgi:signal transduction histidine kinase
VLVEHSQRKQAERQREEAVTSAERERIARDLHDAVTQSIFMAAAIAETLPQVWESKPDEARRGLDELRRLTMGALAEMRNMLIELHPTALTERTLGVLLKQLCDGLMARTKMLVTVSVAGDCHLPDEVQIALYRIAQEALNKSGFLVGDGIWSGKEIGSSLCWGLSPYLTRRSCTCWFGPNRTP